MFEDIARLITLYKFMSLCKIQKRHVPAISGANGFQRKTLKEDKGNTPRQTQIEWRTNQFWFF